MLSSKYAILIELVDLICHWKFIQLIVLGSLLVGVSVSRRKLAFVTLQLI